MGIRMFIHFSSALHPRTNISVIYSVNTAFLNLKIVQKSNSNIFLSFPSRYLKLQVKEFCSNSHFLNKSQKLSPLENTVVPLTYKLL